MPKELHTVTVVSRSYRMFAVVIWALLAAMTITSIIQTDQGIARFAVVPSFVFLAWLSWCGLWRPDMQIDDEGITVRNVLSTARVPWEALVHVSTKYALTLHTPALNVAVFSAPQPGRFTGWRAMRRIRRAGDDDAVRLVSDKSVHVGELPGTESGDAARLIRDRWEQLLERGAVEAGIADEVKVDRQWHIGFMTAFGFGAVLAMAAGGIIALLARSAV